MPSTLPSSSATTRAFAANLVAVGGSRERGVVAAASYETRVFGGARRCLSATARRLGSNLIFVKPRFAVYPLRRSVRLLGVSWSSLQHGPSKEARQLGLAI